jgi:hypothetical protein
MPFDVEQVDLAALATELRRTFQGSAVAGYVRGRTALRDAVVAQLACSEVEAEQLVETMIGRGFLRFSGDPADVTAGDALWIIGDSG